ncbi:Utp14 protein [Metarhizium rileyi]|uniref:Utp14 protein n=1 Tax=Metarhizium rileyi (strain RCEF 4871) TaxID=1649241 RepID=A0A162M6T8_METRR|nr:Utp14 protein [Metarhizium rileyi RCEF 4871]
MPGRQSHGRSLMAAPKAKTGGKKGSKARSQKNALNAFGIAQDMYPTKHKRTPRARELDVEAERKHGRDESEGEEDEEEEEQPQRKKAKGPSRAAAAEGEDDSDSEGNEWRLGGLRDDDEDSEIDSDDAFGDSDNEKFEEYSFPGSKSKTKEHDSEDDSNDDEGETLGADAIDLATALDQWEEESDDEPEADDESGSGDSEEDDEDESEEDDDDEDDTEVDAEKLNALKGLISQYGGEKDEDSKTKSSTGQKLSLKDLGLSGLSDPVMRKSLKLMDKEAKEKRPGAAQKLAVPLSRREQGRLDRSVAYDKTNETLDRWTDTVKQNRRAEHLVFPLPQNSATAGLDTTELQPLSSAKPSNELESAIMSIMEQSGLSMSKEPKPKPQEYDDEGNALSRKEALARRRMERELVSREAKRAKRIKKIKSKAYHRVHRRQRERDEMTAKEAMEEAGEVDSEEEREAQDRRRALERVGQRHKESKWAKIGSKARRAVWDDDFRTGLTEMARRDEELRRRKEGKAGIDGESDSDATSSSGSDDDDTIRRQLKELEEDDDEPQSKLMSMKFMQKAEAARKQANDDTIRQIRRHLDGSDSDASQTDTEVGRRSYGTAENAKPPAAKAQRPKRSRSPEPDVNIITSNPTPSTTGGAWSRGDSRRKKPSLRTEALDLSANILIASQPTNSRDAASTEQHAPLAIRDQSLVARAFAGDDVVAQFAHEKDQVANADDDKIVDKTLPGWGSWVGEGVSNREKKRHEGRFLTKVSGVKRKDRKDAKLDKVIISEKRIKKNDRYLATQLPHPFESRDQYERSLRLPVGPEWMTKETFQNSTKPRILMKQGIIAPMSKPTA